MHDGAFLFHLLLAGIKKSVRPVYLIADPQRHAAAQKAYIAVALEHDNLVVFVVIQHSIDGRCSRVISADNDDFAHPSDSS